jgi:thiol-disulfide isomerase/thioredoxin
MSSSFSIRNLILALVVVVLSASLYWGFQTQNRATSLEAQAQQSLPLEEALHNGKPTLTEFYAHWCRSCQAMAPALASLKKEYGSQINFVMLNVDNHKWLPEVLRYRVDGIPHFVFLDSTGAAIAEAIGELPTTVMRANLQALVAQEPLPYASSQGQTSPLDTTETVGSPLEPRSHGQPIL